ncbi:cyclase family protein [Avibacterium sp. 21-599]|uniref:cyclase family protein n=1 Tax=Avibacterium sp. 21-599 TaxID=2911528 RepID=UPI002246BABA|nr:cyclase family protein [Avibacterium sp. 21-599]MCW9717178.1 cyclase family protein [Avibacterium sp. 21-599]
MNKWIDLSMPISTDHIRWKSLIHKMGNFDDGDLFEATKIEVSCHAFTHMDALSHIKKGAYNILDISPDIYIGEFFVLDLSLLIKDNFKISKDVLANVWPNIKVKKLLFKTNWDTHYSYNSKEFWDKSPYITEDAAIFLANQEIEIIAFDFPQDYPIRGWLKGEIEKPLIKHVTHYYLLSKGITLVEYLCNTSKIKSTLVDALMIPIAIENADGSPCRVLVKNK